MVNKAYIPEQGDIVYFDFSPTHGREQKVVRPGIVLSRSILNKATGLAIIAPITSHIKGYPFEVVVNTKKISGVALIDQIKAIDYQARNTQRVATINTNEMKDAKMKFMALVQ